MEEHKNSVRIPEKIQHVIDVRKKFPDASMNELSEEVYKAYGDILSKSGIKHRLNKIKELAAPYMKEEENEQ